jgi:ABC-type glycerol-3-phosphate transport system substrate-binding protein
MTDAFFNGKFAIWVTHTQIGAQLKDNPGFHLGVSRMPKGPGSALAGGRGTYVGSGFWCVAEAGTHSKLAKQLVLTFHQPKYQGAAAKAFGFIPSSTETKVEMDEISKAFAAAYLPYGVPYRFHPRLNEVKQAVWRAMQALQSGAIGPEEAWKQAVTQGRAALK